MKLLAVLEVVWECILHDEEKLFDAKSGDRVHLCPSDRHSRAKLYVYVFL